MLLMNPGQLARGTHDYRRKGTTFFGSPDVSVGQRARPGSGGHSPPRASMARLISA
jgi:hypothetical protein